MIEFRPIRLADRALIERYTMPSGITNCDLAFANMYCWQNVYHSAWAEVGGFLVIRFHIGGGSKIGYMQPVGQGDFSPIVPALRDDAHANGQRLRLIGLTDQAREALRAAHPGVFAFESDPALSDYIYTADDLRELPGRQYQSKRNHINRFTTQYPDYSYKPLTEDHYLECMALEREWRRAHGGNHVSELSAEQNAMRRAFAHFEELGMLGGCLYVGDRMVAFTYGSAVNRTTFDTHVEKADTDYEGAFAMINKLFAQHLPDGFTLINREEDLGLEGLRRSKRSYYPVLVQPKYTSVRLHRDEAACKALWQEVFGDDDHFVDTFIMRYYSRSRIISAEVDGHLAAMLHLIPFESELGRTTYIYGVATAEAYRRRGLAERLMTEAMQLIEARGDDAAFLIPAEEWLRDFYGLYGFEGAVPTTFASTAGFDFGTGDAARDRAMVWRRKTAAGAGGAGGASSVAGADGAGTAATAPLPESLNCIYVDEQSAKVEQPAYI